MYADRYSRRTKFNPASMGLALALNGTIVIGLIAFAAPHFVRIPDKILDTWNVPVDPPPPPPEPQTPQIKSKAPTPREIAAVPKTIVPTPPSDDHPYVAPPTPPGPIGGTVDGGFVTPPVKPAPVMVGAELDSRFAGSFQPDYPVGERRAEHQGRVVVRVLIGVDGRVKQVEKVSAASDAFFEATERRALQKWRFKPATRDGVPIEAWKNVGVSFVLNDE